MALIAGMLFPCCSFDFSEPAEEFDIIADIVGFTTPDTVEVGTDVRVQISFPSICGGTFSDIKRFRDNTTIRLTPVIHVVRRPNCYEVPQYYTVETTLNFSTAGTYSIIADGRVIDFHKNIVVLSHYNTSQQYVLRYKFLRGNGFPAANKITELKLLDRNPIETLQVQADADGYWSMTLEDTLSRFRYRLGMLKFEAVRGITEDGIILFQ